MIKSHTPDLTITPERKKSSIETCLKSAVKARINIELSKGNITKEMLSDPNAKQEIYTNVENFFRPYCQCVVDKTSSDFPVYDQKPARQAQDPKYGKQLQAHCIKAIHANNNATAK